MRIDVRPASFPAVLAAALLSTTGLVMPVAAQTTAYGLAVGTANYTINFQGKPIGRASYSISSANNGYRVNAHGSAHMENLDFAFSKDELLAPDLEIANETLNGTVNGSAVVVRVQPSGQKFQIDIAANGQKYTNALDRHTNTVFLPDFDPSALLILLRHGYISRDVWTLIPKQTGLLYQAKIEGQPDDSGTLNGTHLSVHHNTVTIANVAVELFFTDDGKLLQEEVPSQGFAMIREGFLLEPPANAPPPEQQ